jgi:release factor glutamine methyltransferase
MKQPPHAEYSATERWQRARQQAFREVGAEGRMIRYLDTTFFVYRNTCFPCEDSQPLVENLDVHSGDSVLDVGTGSGVIAVFSCFRGAGRVLAVDVNPAAIDSARHNAILHGVDRVMEARVSDLFEQVGAERFDVITANLPACNRYAPDVVASAQWDTGFQTNGRFFAEVDRHLKPGGRLYFAQADFGDVPAVTQLASAAGFSIRPVGQKQVVWAGALTFYAFLMQRRREDQAA